MKEDRLLCENRKAYHDYFVFDKWEAGIALQGSEVKSIREGNANLKDSYDRINAGEVFVVNLHISPYSYSHHISLDPTRTRKLLLKKREIEKIVGMMSQKKYACIPLKILFKRNLIKLEIALAKRKKDYDKRQVLREKIHKKEMDQAIKKGFR